MLEHFGCVPVIAGGVEHIPLALVASLPPRIFEDTSIDWEACKADTRCISWVLSSTTDVDVIHSTVRFAADTIWYPEIAGVLSPHILADLFFDCFLDGLVIPGKLEHAGSIGMALASVLSIQLTMEPESPALIELCEDIHRRIWRVPSSGSMSAFVAVALDSVADIPFHVPHLGSRELLLFQSIPDHLSATQRLWLSRIVLQTFWRWRCAQGSTTVLNLNTIRDICQRFTPDDDQVLITNCFLAMAIGLGLNITIRDLYAPNNACVVFLAISPHSLIE